MLARVIRDLKALEAWAEANGYACTMPDPPSMHCSVTVTIQGPVGTPYEGGRFSVRTNLSVEYPTKAPTMAFDTPIHHVNIHETGSVCMNILKDSWRSTLTLVQLYSDYLPELLRSPSPNDGFNATAAAQMLSNPATYFDVARAMAQRHAGAPPHPTTVPGLVTVSVAPTTETAPASL